MLRIVDGEIWRDDEMLATADVLTEPEIEAAMEEARAAIGTELERFADNTLEYVRREARLTFEPLTLPPLHTKFAGRHALVVVRGHDYRSDLAALRSYIREYRPVLIGVDGGADALLEIGLKPDVIIGDFDSVSDAGLHCGAELVHHVHPDGRAPGRENLVAWGVDYLEFVAEGTSEDVAMLLAYESGSQLIVAVGTHATMVEFLDKGRRGHGIDVPDPLAARARARRRERREPALRGPRAPPRHAAAGRGGGPRDGGRRHRRRAHPRVHARPLGHHEGSVLELMINFRFHLASLIAIFLALALGVVVGAGVIDRGVVDTLNNRLDSVERTSDRIKGENSQLRSENSELTQAIGELQCPAVADALVAEDIGIIAVRGVDEDVVNNTVAAAQCAGGTVTGKLWLEDKWALANDDDIAAMAASPRLVVEEAGDTPSGGMEAAGRAHAGAGAGGRHLHRHSHHAPGCGIRQVRDGGRERRHARAVPTARRVDAARRSETTPMCPTRW